MMQKSKWMRKTVKNNKKVLLYRGLAAGMSLIMVLGMLPLGALAAPEKNEESLLNYQVENTTVTEKKKDIRIRTVEDLAVFAEECRVGDFSAGREVWLEADLDLGKLPADVEFAGISSFSGTFHGNKHTISGLVISKGSETMGLFRYIESGAVVKDLTVKGVIDCENSKNMVGGIAGINAGTIRNCSFQGQISSVGITGGIAGFNGASGSIVRCECSGILNGSHMVGGIAGQNRGVISDCTNEASVNAGTDWLELEIEDGGAMSVSGVLDTLQEEVKEGTDFGGIAGFSDGIIAGCQNNGTVGYLHSGRNVGGIVGRQSGEVILCTSSGRVYGKQDVGGIVGQMEPQTVYEDVEELDEKVQELHDLMGQMVDDMEAMGDTLHEDFKGLNQESSEAADTADALMNEMRDVIKKNVDVINELSRRIDYAMNHFAVVTTYLNTALDQVDVILDDLDRVRKDLSIEDQMEEDPYDEAKNRRLVLRAGIGGSLTADNLNPAEGAATEITIHTERGYQLTQLHQKAYGGQEEDVLSRVTGDKYVISSMPAENQTITAVFSYVGGEYVVQSSAGGKAELSDDQKTLKLTVEDGWQVESVTVDGGKNLYPGYGDSVSLPPAEKGRNQRVSVNFQKVSAAHKIKTITGTGGSMTADPQIAVAGETVTLSFTATRGYELDSSSVMIKDAAGNSIPCQTGLKYSFVMPDCDVEAESTFLYHPGEDTSVYAVSNAGGSVNVIAGPATGNTNVVITCENGYQVDHMVVTDSADPAREPYIIRAEEMTKNDTTGVYTCEVASSTLTKPVKLEVVFEKESGTYYQVTTVAGTGGFVTADRNAVTGGDVLKLALANDAHYALEKLLVGGVDCTEQVENNTCEYIVPGDISGDLEVTAQFYPVVLTAQSMTAGGKAAYGVKGKNVIFTITPDTGYTVKKIALKKETGEEIPCQKEYADSEIYSFAAEQLEAEDGYLLVEFGELNNRETVDTAKDNLENQTDHVVDGVNQISEVSDKIKDLLTDEYGDARNPEDLSQEELEELSSLLLDLMGCVSDTGVAAGGILGSTGTIIKVTGPYVEDAADNVNQDLEKMSTDARTMNDSLKNAGKELQGILNYLNALDELQATGFSDNFDKNSEKLKGQMDTVSDILNRLNDHTDFHSGRLQEDMRAVNDKMNEVFTLLIRKLDNVENLVNGEDIYEDRSAEDPGTERVSKLLSCKNLGSVNGDRNVGGIAGCMDVEKTDSGTDKRISPGNKYIARAVVSGCSNEGFLTVKTENGGGIAGNVILGYLYDCSGSGRIQSEEGNCIGGIAGSSSGTISACSSVAVLKGCCYVGGIAGQAEKIQDSWSMPTILKADGWVGAIAGQDMADTRESDDITQIRGTVKERMRNNYYVSSDVYGVNGVSYVGVAEPVTYQELLSMEGVPSLFRHLTVTFLDGEENVVEQVQLPYGADLAELEYPQIVTESGDYMEWEGLGSATLEGCAVIQAVATANVTILSSGKQENGKAAVLAAGTFTGAARVLAEPYEGTLPALLPAGSVCHAVRVILENAGLSENTVTRVRLLQEEEGDTTVYRLENGIWKKVNAGRFGSYEEVEMTGTEAVFCIVSVKKNGWIIWGTAAAAGAVLLSVTAVILHQKKKKKARRRKIEESMEEEV